MPDSGKLGGVSLADQARDRLRAAIIEGKLLPGQRINIEKVAEQLGISRTPIREALKALEMEGMVRIKTHRGAIVEPLVWREIEQRYAIRSMLEGYAAQLACERPNEDLVKDLELNCLEVRTEIDSRDEFSKVKISRIAALNDEFHRRIWRASGSPTLIRFLESLELPRSFSDSFWNESEFREKVWNDHYALTAAFRSRESGKVKMLMEHHMLASADMIAAAAHVDLQHSTPPPPGSCC
jgi:GntR family transcriptional regulator, vanillate catabolism transcriptional regulator